MSSAILERLRSRQKVIDDLKDEMAELEADFLKAEPDNPDLVKAILEKYGPAERLDHPAYIIFVTVVSLNVAPENTAEDPLTEALKPFFPLEGYIGKPGDCLLSGHVEFTSEELLIFKRYNIKWTYSSIGKAQYLDNLKSRHE